MTTKTTITMIDNDSSQDIFNEDGNDNSIGDDNDYDEHDRQPAQDVLLLREVSEVEELARRVALVRKTLIRMLKMRMTITMAMIMSRMIRWRMRIKIKSWQGEWRWCARP